MRNAILKKYQPFLLNTPIGMFLGVLAGIGISWFLSGELGSEWSRLYTFVVTALISLAVAGFAVAGVIANIQAQHERDEEQRRRKLMAEKAFLPWSLSEIIEIAERGAVMSEELGGDTTLINDPHFRARSDEFLAMLPEVRDNLSKVVEHHDNEDFVKHVVSWLSEYQVCVARWRGISNRVQPMNAGSAVETAQRTLGWVYLVALASSMFGYARYDEQDMDAISAEDLRRITRRVRGYRELTEQHERVVEAKTRKYAREFLQLGESDKLS